MTSRIRSAFHRAAPTLIASAAMLGAGCHNGSQQMPPTPEPSTPTVIAVASGAGERAPGMAAPAMPSSVAEAPEPYIDMVMVDAPVRLVLERMAELGKLDLIIPTGINKTISVQYVHVPVSVALQDVLSRSGLRLGTSSSPLPFDTVTVFYRLPANIDSMSSDAIMRRFGVSKPIADLIVKSRPPR